MRRALLLLPLAACEAPDDTPLDSAADSDTDSAVPSACEITELTDSSAPRPYFLLSGPDGAIWFGEANPERPRLGRLTVTGEFSFFEHDRLGSTSSLATGPDGAIWFGNPEDRSIGRLTTAGEFSFFDDPGLSQAWGLVTAPDGNLWFTDAWNLGFGRLTPAGEFSFYPLPFDPNLTIRTLVVGPDGALWAAATSAVARLTLEGELTLHTTPDVSNVYALTSGVDGNLWFTATNPPTAIGRMTPAGEYTVFEDDRMIAPYGLAPDTAGNLWFTNQGSSETVGRMSPSGEFTYCVADPSNNTPFHLIRGPDDAMWFSSGGSIFRARPR